MRKVCSFLLLMFVVLAAHAQIQDPVKFKTELKTLSDTEGEIILPVLSIGDGMSIPLI